MFCKNCGKEVNEKAIACVCCGLPPLLENKYCQECGVPVSDKQVICVKCGVSLGSQNKKMPGKNNSLNEEYSGFYRSSDDKIVLGVCGGLAHKYGTSVSTVRILTIASMFFLIGWLYIGGLFLPSYPTKNL